MHVIFVDNAGESQALHKAFRALLSLRVICRSLHIDKIQKNKIHSYSEISYSEHVSSGIHIGYRLHSAFD